PPRAQIGAIELKQEAGADDGSVLALQHVGQRLDVRLVARVVAVDEEAGGLSRRYRRHEDALGAALLGRPAQVLDVLLDRAEVSPGDRPRARRPLLARPRLPARPPLR